MEKHQVAHEGVGARIGENVAGRSDEKDLGTLAVEGGLHPHPVDGFDFVDEEINHVLERMGLNPQVVAVCRSSSRQARRSSRYCTRPG